MKWILVLLPILGCEDPEIGWQRARDRKWNEACADTSTLLATTSGSPSEVKCENKKHRMRVQVATQPSNEEAAALIFCECQR